MDFFANILRRVNGVGAIMASVFLAGIMVLVVASIVVRPFGEVITGSVELIELLIIVTVAFAFGYTALNKGHIVVTLLVSRFPPRTQAIFESIGWLLSLGIWGWIFWAGVDMMAEKWIREESELLRVPYLPFRLVWVFGLLFISLIFLNDMINSIRKALKP